MHENKLTSIFLDALKACDPERLVGEALSGSPPERVFVFGAGKAALGMAAGAIRARGEAAGGAIIVPSAIIKAAQEGLAPHAGHFRECERAGIRVLEGSHPYPDEKSVAATETLLKEAEKRTPADRAIFVLSGGASALLCKPIAGVTVKEEADLLEWMYENGETIQDINRKRTELSDVKGGKLARFFKCPVTVLVLSDVNGNDLTTIGSGPLYPSDHKHVIVGDGLRLAREAKAIADIQKFEYRELIETPVAGDVVKLAHDYAKRVREHGNGQNGGEILLIRFGEPTVHMTNKAASARNMRGGRNQHLALLLARALAGVQGWSFLAAGSDGIDGSSDAAGAVVDGTTWKAAEHAGLGPAKALHEFNSHHVFDGLKAQVRTGPTGNNLQDLHLLATQPAVKG
ncbi:MAG: DUF4147 domain-containing protein [Deltaproteobacteria bacterium]|nr:DUF4147 domain-containing protein [Deltaproteobacteria bacterium]